MERPERPSRHKSRPVKIPVPPSSSSDSDSEMNDSDVPIQITYYQHPPESATLNAGPSTSSVHQGNQNSTETSSSMITVSPMPLRITVSPINISLREDEPPRPDQPPQDLVRRKRSAASSAAASVIFDSVDTLIGSSSSNGGDESPERHHDRFHHSESLIRPRSFCYMDGSWPPNALHRPHFKLKRPNGPIDLTPNTSVRESTSQASVVTSSFSLRDNSGLPSTTGSSSPSSIYSRNTIPFVLPPSRSDHQQPSSSSILRQFDEMCSPSNIIRKKRLKCVRFSDSNNRYIDPSHSESTNDNPLVTSMNRNTLVDDYCDLVGNFLFNYPSPVNHSENERPGLERISLVDQPQSSSTADIIVRHISSPDMINGEPTIMSAVSPGLYSSGSSMAEPLPGPARSVIENGGAEPMEQSNDDVIVVETPERPPLPGTPDPDLVPSSRSPSPPQPPPQSTASNLSGTQNKQSKSQYNRVGDVPMTLQELNQSLVSLLECPVCLDHATPPIYQCCKGHILCQNCHPRLTNCPICRSHLPGDRNSAMEKVSEKLMYPCKNTVTGCSMMLKLDDKQAHEEGCGFRYYSCILSDCRWKGYKPELVVHLQSSHPDKLISGVTKEVHVPLAVPVGGGMFNTHHWIQSAHNEVFNVIFHVDLYKRIMKGCVIYIGSPEKAGKFSYLFELKQRVPPYRKLSYSRATHEDTLKPGQPLCLNNDFSINIDMARLYRPDDCASHTIPVFISILQVE